MKSLARHMKIEEEIKQNKKFKHEWQKLNINIMFTHAWLSNQMKGHFKQYDITPQQYNILRILKGQYPDPISTSNIRERMIDKMSDTSRIVDRLYKKGLVDRRVCKNDRRLVDVLITEKGLQLIEESIQDEEQLFEPFKKSLTEDEARQLNDLLDKLRS